jgi:predicted transcriptional regulator
MTTEPEEKSRMYDLESQPKGAMISEIEIEILRFVNEFGFCEINQIMKRFGMKKSAAYLSMQLLIRLGLVIQAHIIQGRRGAYIVTHKGITLLELDLPQVRKVSLVTYEHHLIVIDVHLKLKALHPDAVFISERRLTRNKYTMGCGKNEHVPDGVLAFPDGDQSAIEVEKSLKTRDRLEKILFGYGLQDTFKEVWYFCSQDVLHTVKEIANTMPYVKTYSLREFLS